MGQRYNWRRNVFTETVNTDLGELIDCDYRHQDSEQKESSAGQGRTIKPFNLSRRRSQEEKTHTHVRSEDIAR